MSHNLIEKIAKNSGLVIASRALRGVMEIAAGILLARYLGAGMFGVFSFVFAYLTFFTILVDLGVENILVREMSRDPSRSEVLIGNALLLKFCLAAAAVFLACLVINFFKYPLDTKILVYAGSLTILLTVRDMYTQIFRSRLSMGWPAFTEVAGGILKLALFAVLIYAKGPLIGFVLTVSAARLLSLLIMVYKSRELVKPKFKLDISLIKYFFKESWPLALTMVFVVVLTRIDQLMLFQMRGKEAVGLYASAVNAAESCNIIIAAFMVPVFPLLSECFKSSPQSFAALCRFSYKYMMITIMPIAVLVAFFAGPLIRLVYGDNFVLAAPALAVLICAAIPLFFGTIMHNILIAAGRQKYSVIFTGIASVVNISLNLYLIPRWGIVGSSVATLTAYLFICGLGLFLPQVRGYVLPGFAALPRVLASALAMSCYLFYVKTNLFLDIGAAVLIFLAAIFITGTIKKEDFVLVKEHYGTGTDKV